MCARAHRTALAFGWSLLSFAFNHNELVLNGSWTFICTHRSLDIYALAGSSSILMANIVRTNNIELHRHVPDNIFYIIYYANVSVKVFFFAIEHRKAMGISSRSNRWSNGSVRGTKAANCIGELYGLDCARHGRNSMFPCSRSFICVCFCWGHLSQLSKEYQGRNYCTICYGMLRIFSRQFIVHGSWHSRGVCSECKMNQ